MCLAVPMKIIAVSNDDTGQADLDGTLHHVNLSLVDAPTIGDFVIVHAGFAIEKLDEKEAQERLALFAELADSYEKDTLDGKE